MAAFIPVEEARARHAAGTDQSIFTVSGIVINDGHGPLRWLGCFEAFDWRMAEQEARELMHDMVSDGKHGRLIVANVFAGYVENADTDAVYGDDPDRQRGERDVERPWSAPPGFEGVEDRLPMPVRPAVRD